MATKWVRAVGGNDTWSGNSYAEAWATLDKICTYINASGAKGDVFNIVGDFTLPGLPTALTKSLAGTSYDTDPSFTIRGRSLADAPAKASVTWPASGAARILTTGTGQPFIVIQGIKFDMTTAGVTDGQMVVRNASTSAAPRFEYCELHGYTDSHTNFGDALRTWMDQSGTAPTNCGEVRHCYLNNACRPIEFFTAATTAKGTMHDCVWRHVGRWADTYEGRLRWPATPVSASNQLGFYYNTVVLSTTDAINSLLLASPASGNYGTVNWHSNLLWIDTTAISSPVAAIFAGGSGSTATYAGILGYNVILFGPNVTALEAPDDKIYVLPPWSTGGSPKTTDVVDHGVAQSSVFAAPSTAWTWSNINDSGYSIDLPGDFRPVVYTEAGDGGSTPGALPAATTDYTVTVALNKTHAPVNSPIRYTVTISNDGFDAASVLVGVPVPAGITYVSHTASSGTYSAGVWSIPTLADGASATLVIDTTIDADQAGNTITYTATFTDADLASGGDTSDDTDSVDLVVQSTSRVPYLDVEPIYAPDLRLEINSAMLAKINRFRTAYKRYDDEHQRWREYATKRMTVTPSATEDFICGIEHISYILIESTEPVEVSVNGEFAPAATLVLLAPGFLDSLQVRNPSATANAAVTITAVDNGNAE